MRSASIDAPDRVRTVQGRINGTSGVVIAGTGFIASRTGTGVYTLRLSPALRALLSVTATAQSGGPVGVRYASVAIDVITVVTFGTTTSTPSDCDELDFVIRGIAA